MGKYKIIRQIDVFNIKTEELINEIPLELFDLELMKIRFGVPNDDPIMYYQYEIDNLKKDLFPQMHFDFKENIYILACYKE